MFLKSWLEKDRGHERQASGEYESSSPGAAASLAEKRARIRVHSQVPVSVKFGGIYEAIGEAVNISARGMFFVLDRRLQVDTPVDMVFRLPRQVIGLDGVWLRCRAQVVRVKEGLPENKFGIAAAIHTYDVFRVS